MANGQVYVFNLGPEAMISVSVNGQVVGAVNAWSAGSPALRYTASGIAVPRVLNSSDSSGKFYNGKNILSFVRPSGVAHIYYTIDGQAHPITEDIIINIEWDRFQVIQANGVVAAADSLGSGPAIILGPPQLSAARKPRSDSPGKTGARGTLR